MDLSDTSLQVDGPLVYFTLENMSSARVASGGNEGCVVDVGVGRCAWEAVYSADSPSSKPSSVGFTLWRLALASDDERLRRWCQRIPESFGEDDQEF
jgi:hypothetical protein